MEENINMQEQNEQEDSGQSWLTTYADMMTLLFAFFVLLYSMSSPDPVKMSQIQDAMEKEAGFEGTLQTQSQILEEFEDIVEELNLESTTNIISDPRGVALEMDGDICFQSASTEIEGPLQRVLNTAAEKIFSNKEDYRMIIIEGHTGSLQSAIHFFYHDSHDAGPVHFAHQHLTGERTKLPFSRVAQRLRW